MAASNVGVPPATFTAQSAINTAVVLDAGVGHAYHTLIVTGSAGTFTTGTIVIELSDDGTNWFGPASNSITPAASTVSSVTVGPIVAQMARARISVAITGGGVATASVASA